MKKALFTVFLFFMILKVLGQINPDNSSVQVIGYWDKKEKKRYVLTNEQLKIQDTDTLSRNFHKYAVDITIVDSTENSYTINWFYHDYEVQSDDEIFKLLASIAEGLTVIVITDELGTFKEIKNWQEVRDYILKGTKLIKQQKKEIPNIDNIISQVENMYSTRESIETAVMHEIQQFYTFHGSVYKLGEVIDVEMKVTNGYGGEPFDANVSVWLDEINPADNNFVIRMIQVVNQEQLTKAAFDYFTKFAKTTGAKPPVLKDIPPMKNELRVAARIHGSGWIIYSVQTKEVSGEGRTNITETVIEMQ